jgi:hypothetical protein
MKLSCILFLALILFGCKGHQQRVPISGERAKLLAIRLANDKATSIYHRSPFHDGQPANFLDGHWYWRQLTDGDLEATVELAADGSTNKVTLTLLTTK